MSRHATGRAVQACLHPSSVNPRRASRRDARRTRGRSSPPTRCFRRAEEDGDYPLARMLIRAKAPLRISFAGGGTDVPPYPEREGGLVLNATIDRYAYGTLCPRDDNAIGIESHDYGMSAVFDVHEPLVFDGKLDLAKAAIRRFAGRETRGFDLWLHSNAPPGSGLGSSSTMMVTIIGALTDFRNLPLTDY